MKPFILIFLLAAIGLVSCTKTQDTLQTSNSVMIKIEAVHTDNLIECTNTIFVR